MQIVLFTIAIIVAFAAATNPDEILDYFRDPNPQISLKSRRTTVRKFTASTSYRNVVNQIKITGTTH